MNSTNKETGTGTEVHRPAAPLEGVRVLDLGQYIAGPGAAMVLAELGAEVIKVEPLAGDQARHIGRYGESMIRAYSRGKRSIALDLKSEAGLAVAWRLIEASDVVIQNLRPGAIEALGLGPDTVRARFPQIVFLSISGFGTQGPSALRPGYDIAAQAESGLMSLTGEPDRLPQKVGVPVIDAAAAHLGAQAVLAALVDHPYETLSRERLIALARGRDHEAFDRSIDVMVSRLRRLVEDDPRQPRWLQTVWGKGYVFVPDGGESA